MDLFNAHKEDYIELVREIRFKLNSLETTSNAVERDRLLKEIKNNLAEAERILRSMKLTKTQDNEALNMLLGKIWFLILILFVSNTTLFDIFIKTFFLIIHYFEIIRSYACIDTFRIDLRSLQQEYEEKDREIEAGNRNSLIVNLEDDV